jgi:putative ABC transport system permease protein
MNARRLITRYALKDLSHDRRITFLSILLYIVILAPVCILYVLKFGVVTAWTEDLAKDMRNREVRITGEYALTGENLAELQAISETGFLVPEASFLVSTQPMRRREPERGPWQDINFRTTRAGDPATGLESALSSSEVIVTTRAAESLEIAEGDVLEVRLSRQPKNAGTESTFVRLDVADILPEAAWPGGNVFISPALALDIRDWLQFDHRDDTEIWAGDRTAEAVWQSLRIYASTVKEAVELRDKLEEKGFATQLNTDQIARLVDLEAALNALFVIILAMSGTAFLATAFLLQWLAVTRKRPDFALMSVAGFTRQNLRIFPVVQSVATTTTGIVLAIAVALIMFAALYTYATDLLSVSRIALPPIWHALIAAALTLMLSVLGSLGAMRTIGTLDITKLIRSD